MARIISLVLFLVLAGVGCHRSSSPTLAGGKPVAHWVQILQSSDPHQRKSAVAKLGNVGAADAAVLPALRGALADADPGVRREAIVAVMKYGGGAAPVVPLLADLQERDPDPQVRDYAAKAVKKMRGS
jgi:HEAT repeat protein